VSDSAPATEHRSTPVPATTVVSATGLEIRVPEGPVLLRPASLTVRAGRITALTGPPCSAH
jgi:peptide/nickel transport system ATP-binding protein